MSMNPINPKDAKYYLSLGLTLVVKHQGQEVIRGNQTNSQMATFLNLKDHEYFIPINRKHRFLKYLTGQIFIGYFLGYIFGLLGLMFALILLSNLSLNIAGHLSPFLLITGITSFSGFKIATRARKRITKSLNKKKR